MNNFDIKKYKNVYFIGIGGVSMSAIALILKNSGFFVSGSDRTEGELVKKLKENGIKVNIGHNKENINDDIELIVYSKAIHDDNEEIIEAKIRKIALASRSEVLGSIMDDFKININVAGTHGKSTITSIVGKVLLDAGLNPTINVGANNKEIGGNYHIGNKDYFVVEACEYTNSFHDFRPTMEIITNIEAEHLDFFKNINDIRDSFKKFINLLPSKENNGLLVINNNIEKLDELTHETKAKVVTYGNKNANYFYDDIKKKENGTEFKIYRNIENNKNNIELLGEIKTRLLGNHNVENITGAVSLLDSIGISFDIIEESLKTFTGAERRLEFKGVYNNIQYINDYAHHPSEIKKSIEALNEIKKGKLYVIFQPHTYTRLKSFYNDFVEALCMADKVLILPIYAAREKDIYNVSSTMLSESINKNISNKSIYCNSFEDAIHFINDNASKNDLVCVMGAGDIDIIFNLLVNNSNNDKLI